ncbi:MAG: dTMP kinase [Elusimicrobiota bacterium]|nr:dTMP kinase [Elusimicrobiota bacterium]
MIRALIALLIINSFPAPALAQVARVAGPVRVSVTVPALSVSPGAISGLTPSLSAPSLGSPLGAAPVLAPAPVAPAAPVALLPLMPAAATPSSPKPQPVRALAAAKTAAASAAQLSVQPGSLESNRARVDFVDGAPDRTDFVEAPPTAEAPARLSPASPVSGRRAPAPAAPRLAPFLGGTFLAQVASNALQVTMPLLILQVTGSAATAAFSAVLSSVFDAAGTFVGGRLTDRFGSKRVLVTTTIVRGAAVLTLPLLAAAGLTLPAVLGVYMVESLARGVADTARSTLPSELAGKDEGYLKKVLSKNQSYFEAGGIAGPFLAGALIAGAGGAAAAGSLWLAPVAFAGVTLAYLGLSNTNRAPPAAAPQAPVESPKANRDGWMKWALGATALLTLYPLKGLLPAIFATSILNDPASAAWLVGLFGVGGLLGSVLYGRLSGRASLKTWLSVGSVGTIALSVAFLPGAFIPAALGVLLFGAANVAARLSLNAAIQARAPEGKAGAAVGAARFTANLTSLSVRFLAGLAFAAALAPAASFWLLGGGILAVAGAQLWTARKLAALGAAGAVAGLSPVHGLPGRLIVVEGLDGSGKSTQMEMLKDELEAKDLKVVVTTWNSSEMVSGAVKKAKKDQSLTPKTFSLLHASDLADRLDKVILPALEEGSIVLADRWFFTALARDRTRGMDAKWLRGLYAFAPKPDLVLYYKLPVKTAIGRVLARSEGRLGLSEDYAEDDEAARLSQERHGLKFYEAGLDAKLSADPLENFNLFQTRVSAEYDAQAREFGFKVIDSSRSREEIRADTMATAFGALGSLAAFRKDEKPGAKANLFDKDPAGDADNIRRNYLHEKRGAHFYFRNMLLPMQTRFAQLLDMASTPRALLHGSPHVDNYAKSGQGAAMVDFDRSRVGPYSWDLVRLMVSLSLRQKKDAKGLLDKEVLKRMKKGYLRGFRHPDRPFSEVRELKDIEPEAAEVSTNAYLKANKKWAKEMRRNALAADDADVVTLVNSWAAGRGDGVLNDYFIEEAGRGQGSMGFRGLFLVVLAPKDKKAGLDRILLNIKATRTDPDTEWYKSPYGSEAERMRAAAEIYAPGWELRAGGAVLDGVEYYARQIDPLNAKIKKMLSGDLQEDFAYAVGTQLGRAHRLSLDGATPAELEAHLESNFDAIAAAGRTIRDEIMDAHARYLLKMKRDGLTPPDEREEE